MFRRKARTLAATGAAVGLLISGGVASAASDATFPNANYGFDGNAHLIVGGGSTTLYPMMQSLAKLYMDTETCATNISSYNAAGTTYPQTTPAFNQCTATSTTPVAYTGGIAGGNFDGDTVAIAEPAGSSTGIASLNGAHSGTAATYAYEGVNANLPTSATGGSSNGYGTVDFALSSRGAKTSSGNCPKSNPTTGKAGDELQCDTFWGIASDGVDVFTFNSSVGGFDLGSGGFSATDLYNIYTCQDTTWGSLPEYKAAAAAYEKANGTTSDPNLPAAAAPIVPFGINPNSGTLGDFQNYINANVPAANNAFTPNTACARSLSTGSYPLENDVKPLIADAEQNAFTVPTYPAGTTSPYPSGTTSYPAGISTDPLSPQNPVNWLWFGSYGLLTEFPYLSGGTVTTTNASGTASSATFSTGPVPIASGADPTDGLVPSATDIGNDTYPIERVLSVVTPKADADCPTSASICNFSANPGPTNGNGIADLNVTGATSGPAGAVREFVRFLCRPNATTEPIDPYTGVNTFTEIKAAIAGSGFEPIPSALASPGSACDVQSVG